MRAFLVATEVADHGHEELAMVLDDLGFVCVGKAGSHRTWRLKLPGGNVLRITLVKPGSGSVKAVYVRKMREMLVSSPEIMRAANSDAD